MSVNKNVVTTQGENQKAYILTTPKTKSSIRDIPIPKVLMNDLKTLYEHSKNIMDLMINILFLVIAIPLLMVKLDIEKIETVS